MLNQDYQKTALSLIGQSIQIAIKERKTNIDELSRNSGVSRTIIYKILKGESYEISGLIKIMRILEMHIDIYLKDINNSAFLDHAGRPSPN